jgi:hypothetical protein
LCSINDLLNSFMFGSELQKLHKKFVLGNILQESEFWATRKVLHVYIFCLFHGVLVCDLFS